MKTPQTAEEKTTAVEPGQRAPTGGEEKVVLRLGPQAEQLPYERLSDRELEIFQMIAAGKTVSRIAQELHLSVTAVGSYRGRALKKLHVTTTAELIRYAIRSHLVD